MLAKKNHFLARAYEALIYLSGSEEKRLEYEARQKAIRDHDWLMQCNREEGFQAGLDQGFSQGMNQGQIQGLFRNVKYMLGKGISVADVADLLGEDLDKVRNIHELIKAHPDLDEEGLYKLYKME